MSEINKTQERIQSEIDQIATALELMEEHANNRTYYKKELEDGVSISKPKSEKIRPLYSILCCKNDKWTKQITKSRRIEDFRATMARIIQKFQPDFIRVATYRNDNKNPQKAGEEIYTVTINENAPQPPEPQELQILTIKEPEVHTQDFQTHDVFRAFRSFMDDYKQSRDSSELGKIEAVKTEMNFQYQLLQKENEMNLFKVKAENLMEQAKRDYDGKIRECDILRIQLDQLQGKLQETHQDYQGQLKSKEAEIEELEETIEKLDDTIADLGAQIVALQAAIQQHEGDGAKTRKTLTGVGMVATMVAKGVLNKHPEAQKFLDGLAIDLGNALEGYNEQEDFIPEHKEGEAKVVNEQETSEPKTEEDKIREKLHGWIDSVKQIGALKLIAVLADHLATGTVKLQQIYDLCQNAEKNRKDKSEEPK